MPLQIKGYAAVSLAACILGVQATLNRLLILEGIPPLPLAIMRMFFAALSILLILLIKNPKGIFIEKKDIVGFIIYGVISVGLFNFFYMNSLQMTNAVTTTILLYTAPIFVTIISTIFLREKLTYLKVLAVGMTFGGCFLVAGGNNLTNFQFSSLGILAGLGAGFCYSQWIILGKKLLIKYSPWTVSIYGNLIGILSLFPLCSPTTIIKLDISPRLIFYIFLLTFFTMVLGHAIYYYGLNYIESSRASILANLEPVVSVILAYFILGEILTIPKFLGFILILTSIFLVTYQEISKKIRAV